MTSVSIGITHVIGGDDSFVGGRLALHVTCTSCLTDRVTLIYSFEKRKREIRMKKSFRCGRLEVLKKVVRRPGKMTLGR